MYYTWASIPWLHVANWWQMTVSITKTKFAADIGCFKVNHIADNEDTKKIKADIWVIAK